jgi:protein-S-isoprenylcysteine O-methyltransferase Ste14
MPLLAQPRFIGSLRLGLGVAGALLVSVGAILWGWGVRLLEPSVGWGDESNPKYLVIQGPYKWMRHPIYVGAVTLMVGWILLNGALYSLLLCPIFYLMFHFEAYLEEKSILGPKFGHEFQRYKEQIPAFFGRVGTAILALIYLLLVIAVAWGFVPIR